MRKRKGQIEITISLYLMVFLVIMIAVMMQLRQFREISRLTEDALAASNLASAIIDVQEYGVSHNILVSNPENAFQIYQRALKFNMKLNDNWKSKKESEISGEVDILEYIIYNVRGNDVEIYCYGHNPYTTVMTGGLGNVCAPNGKVIVSTSVYSHITYPMDGILGVHITAEKDMLVDIVNN